jgi:PAS domain S-box-containing protein
MDITDRRRAEEALWESEKKYRQLFMNAPSAIYEVDYRNRCFINFNEIIPTITGYSREELMQMDPWELFTEESRKTYLERMRLMKEGSNVSASQEYELRRKDGGIVWVDMNIDYTIEDGLPVKASIVVHDITDRKRAEVALQESEERYRTLVENANDIIFRTDNTGHFIFINPVALRLSGFTLQELIGKHYLEIIRPDMRDAAANFFGRQFVKQLENTYFEYPIIIKNGQERWIGQNTQLMLKDDNVIGFQAVARDVTERKHFEEALSESEKLYKTLAESSFAGVFIVQEGKFRFINNSAIAYAGYSAEELVGCNSDIIVHPDDKELVKSKNREMLAGRSNQAFEFRMVTKQNDVRWLSQTVTPIQYEGRPAILGNAIDVTELKQAQDLYETLAENSLAGVFIAQDGKFRFINNSAIAYAGYSAEELVGRNSDSIVHPDDKELVKSKSREMLAGRSNQAFEFRMVTKQSDVRWLSQTVTPIQYRGKPAILGNAIDVTELKRAEEALKESEQRLHDIIDFLPDATYAIDLEGKVIAWNRAMEEMTGVKARDMLGKGDKEYAIPFYGMRRPLLINLVFLPDKEIEDNYSFVKKEGGILIAEVDAPVGGNPRALWGIARPLHDSKGNVVGAIESIRDISERKRAEEARYHHEKIKGVLEMAGAICHEMNQPMQLISGYSEILLMNISENDPTYTQLDTINKQVHRMATITRKLMKIKDYETQDYAGFSRIIDINKSSDTDTE